MHAAFRISGCTPGLSVDWEEHYCRYIKASFFAGHSRAFCKAGYAGSHLLALQESTLAAGYDEAEEE